MAKKSVSYKAAVQMFTDMGFTDAKDWKPMRVSKKLNSNLAELITEENEPRTAASKKLLKSILAAVEEGQEIVVTEGAAPSAGKGGKKTPAKKAPVKGKKKPPEDEDDDEDSDDDDADDDDADDDDADEDEDSDDDEDEDEDEDDGEDSDEDDDTDEDDEDEDDEDEDDEDEDSDEDDEDEDDEDEDSDEDEDDGDEDADEDSDEDDDTDEDEDETPPPKKKGKHVATKKAPVKGKKGKPAAAAKPAKSKKEKPAAKPAKGKKAKPRLDEDGKPVRRGPKGVGIIDTIIAILRKASKVKPIRKSAIVAKLVKKYPDREESALKSTVNSQVPHSIQERRGEKVFGTAEKGFWMASED